MVVLPARATRFRLVAFVISLAALASSALLSCSADPQSPLGSDSDLIGSKPGTVYRDTLGVYADTSYAFNSVIFADTSMQLGRQDGYQRSMLIQPGFSSATADINRVVDKADLYILAPSIDGSFPIRFYQQPYQYAEGDSVAALDTLTAIADPNTGSPDRSLEFFPGTYPLPPALVQDWIGSPDSRTAIGVVYTDNVNERVATVGARTSKAFNPYFKVHFKDGGERTYYSSATATFVRPTTPPPPRGRFASDGYVRRIYFRTHLDQLAPNAAVHTARVHFRIVPGSLLGVNTTLLVYVPNSTNPASKDFLSGQAVIQETVVDTDSTLDIKVSNAVFLMLKGTLKDNGFVIRFLGENSEVRQIQLYGSDAAPVLRPVVYITSSTPAEFHP